ncbi:uncharacterized protein LOC143186171 isoform X2 [Calliopsis andreniformis]|uniref:uncharacterized protein LOC143186171 isoform X2 n=1 Tax=Calliopsis andreniformis TaxID=337506 RepID=UPI003FCE965C
MSDSGKSVKPVRQLSLQPPAPRRQQIRRQRSAEDDKSLQICASPLARGKRGTHGKPGFERPKVRVAWTEGRRKNEKELEHVEVVARQIPGRSKPITGRSRGFAGIEKPTILYTRQELAERLRLAWKHREENKANINIFLAHGTLEKRCDSEMSVTITAPTTPLSRSNTAVETPEASYDTCKATRDEEPCMFFDGDYGEKGSEDSVLGKSIISVENGNRSVSKTDYHEVALEEEDPCPETRRTEVVEEDKMIKNEKRKDSIAEATETSEPSSSPNTDCSPNPKKRTPANIDSSNPRVQSTSLPAIKLDNSTSTASKTSKEDFSSAKQKRASFHSGTNRAFLGPVRSATEFRWNPVSEKTVQQKVEARSSESRDNASNKPTVSKTTPETKCNTTPEKAVAQKTIVDGKSNSIEKARLRTTPESKDTSVDNKIVTQKANNGDKVALVKRSAASSIAENKEGSIDKVPSARQMLEERCSSVIERNPAKKMDARIDQKSRRTSSAPPQRHLGNASSNRVQVNIVIDTPTTGRSDKERNMDCKDNAMEKPDATKNQVPGRSVRSAPLKRRSRSAKRRFWGKTDEDRKSRNRSAGRARNSIDSKAIDIVTMVSLVSSADSDSDTENSPGDDKLIDELRSKLPTTSIIKTSANPISFAKRPIKSVSFQRDSLDFEDPPKEQQPPAREERKTTTGRLAIVNHRGNGGTLSSEETVTWRTDIPGLALPVLALIHDSEETADIPLTDREKRCLAVPIGDLHDKKRKLLKTRSTPSRSVIEKQISSKTRLQSSPRIVPQKMEAPTQQFKTPMNSSSNTKEAFVATAKEAAQEVQSMPMEPQFQTNKEKECWHLYRKMCDKGVCVSFDTVLRGMLTPTEYRLRQRELLQDL